MLEHIRIEKVHDGTEKSFSVISVEIRTSVVPKFAEGGGLATSFSAVRYEIVELLENIDDLPEACGFAHGIIVDSEDNYPSNVTIALEPNLLKALMAEGTSVCKEKAYELGKTKGKNHPKSNSQVVAIN